MIHPLSERRYAAALAGHLGGEWAANLCSALAQRRIDIRSGHAVRDEDGYWMARFEMIVPETEDLMNLDWLGLCERRTHYTNASLHLDGYDFTEVTAHGGSIRLDLVETPDSVGLLAVVFSWLHSLGLVPVEFRAETRQERVYDQFWLKAIAETRPRDEVCVALGRKLAAFVAT